MTETVHLVVEQGEDKGKEITVPPDGARLGRSSKNDIVLIDPVLSRYHCRLFFKTGEGLWITDLGSANQTLVNDKPVQEVRVRVGDRVTVGATVMKVLNDAITAAGQEQPISAGAPVIDLGLVPDKKKPGGRKFGRVALILIACLVTALALAVWLPEILTKKPARRAAPATLVPEIERTLEIDYEKVKASPENIFRYRLQLTKDNMLSIQIDDTEKTHVPPEKRKVGKKLIQDLGNFIEDAGFFTLEEKYEGILPDVLEQWDLSITIGRKTHRTKVVNRVEPEIFNSVREKIEKFGQVELGLWAIQFPPEKLLQMARNAFLLGKKLYDEREIKYGNLAAAIKSFDEAEFYLKTVEPKPDFYPEVLAGITDCKEQLREEYDERNFLAQRAIKLREWEEAAKELRIICEMIPDSSDERHEEARKKLLEVQSRLNSRR